MSQHLAHRPARAICVDGFAPSYSGEMAVKNSTVFSPSALIRSARKSGVSGMLTTSRLDADNLPSCQACNPPRIGLTCLKPWLRRYDAARALDSSAGQVQ